MKFNEAIAGRLTDESVLIVQKYLEKFVAEFGITDPNKILSLAWDLAIMSKDVMEATGEAARENAKDTLANLKP